MAEAYTSELASTPGSSQLRTHALCPGLANTPLMHSSNEMTEGREGLAAPIDGTQARGDQASETSVNGTSHCSTLTQCSRLANKVSADVRHLPPEVVGGRDDD